MVAEAPLTASTVPSRAATATRQRTMAAQQVWAPAGWRTATRAMGITCRATAQRMELSCFAFIAFRSELARGNELEVNRAGDGWIMARGAAERTAGSQIGRPKHWW